ncbi:unnamed protein product [Cuscuta campestris]|uniref:Uncharacterized protein n=1 Tax=Cuscuta campestris TaxID=132261 RepID=A0A484MGL3_9ASTE|nr:unnamed protein product [Cuscuta campestris]
MSMQKKKIAEASSSLSKKAITEIPVLREEQSIFTKVNLRKRKGTEKEPMFGRKMQLRKGRKKGILGENAEQEKNQTQEDPISQEDEMPSIEKIDQLNGDKFLVAEVELEGNTDQRTSRDELNTDQENGEDEVNTEQECSEEEESARKKKNATVEGEGKMQYKEREKNKQRKRKKRVRGEEGELNKIGVKSIKTRMSPKTITELLKNLSEEQKEDVREMGFGSLLQLDITHLPLQLGYWLVENFDTRSVSLKLPSKKEIHIDETSIHSTIGFPMGGESVMKQNGDKSEEAREVMRAWKLQFPVQKGTVRIADVRKSVEENKGGGEMFKRNLMVLIVSFLIEGKQNCSAAHKIVNALVNVSEIKNLNWCSYTLESLIEATDYWKANKSRFFGGPLLFLIVFYVDNVIFKSRRVQRQFPSFVGWNARLLWERERAEKKSGGYGYGYIDVPNVEKIALTSPNLNNESQTNQSDGGNQDELHVQKEKIDVIKAFASATKNLAEAISTFDEKLRAAVQVLPNDEAMKMLVERVYNLLDGYSKENVQEEEKESTREEEKEWTFSQDDEYWRSEEVMKAIDAIEKAQKRRQERAQCDGPTFRLLSQESQERRDNEMVHDWRVAADHVGGVTENAEKESDWGGADVGGVIEENIELEANVGDEGQVTEPTHTENGELQADVADVANVKKVPSEDQILDMAVEKNNREVELNKKGNQDECPERIAERQKGRKRDVALSAALRSPFMNRIVDIRSALTIEERMVEAFTFSADSDDNVLYKEGDRAIKKGHFQSLKLNSAVSFEIIDLWTDILNHKEKFKSNDSSAIVFFPTKICDVLDYNVGSSATTRNKNFVESMEKMCPMSINREKKDPRATEVQKLKTERLDVGLNVMKSHTDSGVFAMRFMETYKGEAEWDCGLENINEKLMQKLRTRYLNEMLTFEKNEMKEEVVKKIKSGLIAQREIKKAARGK